MQSIWHRFQPGSGHYCSWVTNLHPQAASTNRRCWGSNRRGSRQTDKQTNCTASAHTCVRTFCLLLTHKTWAHTLFVLSVFFPFYSSITHTQTHTGIQAFYRASVGWLWAALWQHCSTKHRLDPRSISCPLLASQFKPDCLLLRASPRGSI